MKENPEKFLPEKYPELPGSKPVERAVQKKIREGEKGPTTKEARVEAYLDRIEKILSSGTRVKSERGWELLKNKIIKEFAIKADDPDTLAKIAHGLYESEKKLAIEQGRGADIERLERQSEDQIVKKYEGLVQEKRDIQVKTLSEWLNYLKLNDAEYPMWFQYFVVRNLQKMGTIEKEKGEYAKRTPLTVAPFPELNPEALGFVYRMLSEGPHKDDFKDKLTGEENKEKREKLENLIAKKDFAKLYAFAQLETAGQLNKESVEGGWIKYNQGSDHHVLEDALRNKGTGWCTAQGSAYAHLQGGDFYVYYTKGSKGQYTEPRIAIRMEGDKIGEARGVAANQNLEAVVAPALEAKLKEFGPEAESYKKKTADMKRVTELYDQAFKKDKTTGEETYLNPEFTKEDLTFLYEINAPIEGFGYPDASGKSSDPRVAKLRSQRNPGEDMLIIFEAAKDQIAHNPQEINEKTKAYVGPLQKGIFDKIQEFNVEHIYTSFPEGRIRKETIEIGGKTEKELEKEFQEKKINIGDYAKDMMRSKDFTTLKNSEKADLIRLKVKDLFSDNQYHTAAEVYQRAEEFGLELCPAEVGPNYRLQYKDQPLNERIYIAMKQIADRDGVPVVFGLERHGDGLWLESGWVEPRYLWGSDGEFVFRLRKSGS